MKELAFRLVRGDDLRSSIEDECRRLDIGTAVVLSGVGSLTRLHIRQLCLATKHHKKRIVIKFLIINYI